jgi:hypothetical protein
LADCELGQHVYSGTKTLFWCCPKCLETFRKNHNEIAHQAEMDRQFKLEHRRSPYALLPYYVLTLAFTVFLTVFFL